MHTLNLLYRVCFFLFTFYMRVYVLDLASTVHVTVCTWTKKSCN